MSGPRFKLRTVLFGITFVAILVGWYTSLTREQARSEREVREVTDKLSQKLRTVQTEERMTGLRGPTQNQMMRMRYDRSLEHGELVEPNFEKADLRGFVIQAGEKAFERTNFDGSNLRDATLTGGDASFQGASFKFAKLNNSNLTGGDSSFKLAVFEYADLSGAVLKGDFQGALFKSANCTGATIIGSLNGANIDGAQFEDADLTGIGSNGLKSCYFGTPPSYNANTKFPVGFDPKELGWQQ